jgi:hypothetical protein
MSNDVRETLILFGHRPGVLHFALFDVPTKRGDTLATYPTKQRPSWFTRLRKWIEAPVGAA